jgi:hypothetical protein
MKSNRLEKKNRIEKKEKCLVSSKQKKVSGQLFSRKMQLIQQKLFSLFS